ncbi:MAG: tautomerase family protein [Methanobacteriaceae archaeon]|jgi:4-oxalocrotonate tautomerase family enzyme|nr:tautomerase family protein [Candidatus Methanorudis spinitermitis]
MPFTKISLIKGKNKSFLQVFKEEILSSLINILKLPSDDRNIFLMEYEEESFEMKDPYEYLIEIAMFFGRSDETKKLLFKTIVDSLNAKLNIKKESIFIFINEQPLNNWGVRGGKSAEEVDLGFKVNIKQNK